MEAKVDANVYDCALFNAHLPAGKYTQARPPEDADKAAFKAAVLSVPPGVPPNATMLGQVVEAACAKAAGICTPKHSSKNSPKKARIVIPREIDQQDAFDEIKKALLPSCEVATIAAYRLHRLHSNDNKLSSEYNRYLLFQTVFSY
ncbi:hypothetical protein [Caballeronia sp. BR00000012568055]|uniref:hypothetical protein n=1 Tax=Caballeronia sp. BR00000012568055 TaxID=2918761 RepID=UPI0023F66129|nr:hypothetical protein [Caballeronia sp. BR00000012568055]